MKRLFIVALLTFSIDALAVKPGTYQAHQPDNSTDILIVNEDGSLSLETTRQVGGPGGISNGAIVPYPTVCRTKEWGKITSESAKYIEFDVKYVHLTDLTGLRDTENCERYIGEFNGMASVGKIAFAIMKSEFSIP